jgi:predicted O-methyltransferase YrrM
LPPDAVLPEPQWFPGPALCEANCFIARPGEIEWYPAAMMGGQAIARRLTGDATYVRRGLELMTKLTPDDYTSYMERFYREGIARFADQWGFADIVTVLLGLADILRPKSYLEIGVRRGRSLCAVASVRPDCEAALFDIWTKNYAGMENPGPSFVREELLKVGYRGNAEFTDGNSHQTIPAFFKRNPTKTFDIITVDGDHTNLGAAQDIADVLPHVSIGGAIVFDDVCHPKHPGLADVWRRMVVENRRFSAWTYSDVGYGVGVAIRKV